MSIDAMNVKLETTTEENVLSPSAENIRNDLLERYYTDFDNNIFVKEEPTNDTSFADNDSMLIYDAAVTGESPKIMFSPELSLISGAKSESLVVLEEHDLFKPSCREADTHRDLHNNLNQHALELGTDKLVKREANVYYYDNKHESYGLINEYARLDFINAGNAIKHEEVQYDSKEDLLDLLKNTEQDQTQPHDFNDECSNISDQQHKLPIINEVNFHNDTGSSRQDNPVSIAPGTAVQVVFACDLCSFRSKFMTEALKHFGAAHVKETEKNLHLLDHNFGAAHVKETEKNLHLLDHNFGAAHVKETEKNLHLLDHNFGAAHVKETEKNLHLLDHNYAANKHDGVADRKPDNKLLQCQLCEYSTIWKAGMNRHVLRKHSKTKPFRCDICDYGAVQKAELTVHIMRKHGKEKPHKCDKCEYSGVRKQDLVLHVLSKHSEKNMTHKCSECEYTTKRKSNLVIHVLSQHSMKKPHKEV